MVGANNSFPLEQAIVDTVREPLLVLDPALRVVLASRAFCLVFAVTREETEGRLLYDLGNGQWNIPSLRTLLEEILPQKTTVEEYEVAHVFPTIGYRTMLLNARRVLRRAQARVPCCSRLRT
jgi:chemotaxis protein methyltransferase CheR